MIPAQKTALFEELKGSLREGNRRAQPGKMRSKNAAPREVIGFEHNGKSHRAQVKTASRFQMLNEIERNATTGGIFTPSSCQGCENETRGSTIRHRDVPAIALSRMLQPSLTEKKSNAKITSFRRMVRSGLRDARVAFQTPEK